MSRHNALPLNEVSINDLFFEGEKCTYEIPVYQRNYAWEKEEIGALIRDVDDSFRKNPDQVYYIGTLVAYNKGDKVYEVIDGQQRLTTIYLILNAFNRNSKREINSKLTYRARKKSDDTLRYIRNDDQKPDEIDPGMENGFKYVCEELAGLESSAFREYFLNKVHIIRYMVPRDIDLNHYFEIMNSRGEQLEKHEIIKAELMQKLNKDDSHIFHLIWDACSEMNVYVQLKTKNAERVFAKDLYHYIPRNYDELKAALSDVKDDLAVERDVAISEIISSNSHKWLNDEGEVERKDSFQPIIDFPNFLLVVLKLLRLSDPGFSPVDFNLDDKELLNEFDNVAWNEEKIKRFTFYMFKCKFLLDNFVVHHSKEEDTLDSNPWKLQVWHKDYEGKQVRELLKNLIDDKSLQDRLVHLLSMFEVSFTARQRKNYLVYCLLYLMNADVNDFDGAAYAEFLENMAYRYFAGVYMSRGNLSDVNKPLPGSFDDVMLDNGILNNSILPEYDARAFNDIYGDGSVKTKGIPLFIFDYMDYRIWKFYDAQVRGERLKEESRVRREFFDVLGCGDFGLKLFDQFYFSRTRKSLEHYYPQNQATGKDGALNEDQINCFGNFAMIGAEANSSGSNWSPHTKLDHYLDSSMKIRQVSVASLKFMIMMQMCKDNGKWDSEEIQTHQRKMLALLL